MKTDLTSGGRGSPKNKFIQVKNNMAINCPICESSNHSVFLSISEVPVHCNLICCQYGEALNVVRGDIDLALCRKCGHVFNAAFNPALMRYSGSYENSLHFSERFREYTDWLAEQLIERHSLNDKKIAEIGCGQGDFLKLVCKRGGNEGIGFDPGYRGELDSEGNNHAVRIIKEFYSDQLSESQVDFIICRHVLEHIYDPRNFLDHINRTVDNNQNTKLFFEVPSLLWTLRDFSIWDIIYEHYSYFSSYSLSRLFSGCGFSVHAIYETYEKQFLCIEASKSAHQNGNFRLDDNCVGELLNYTGDFTQRFQNKIAESKNFLTNSIRDKKKVVLWGAGSKGVTFLNILNIKDQIRYVVDINPRKQGKYIAGTGQEIVNPKLLKDYKPDYIVVMNPIYLNEIKKYVRDELGLSGKLLAV
ncbi:MAG: class I SAM-dependent methyltransferase [Deltaproteobacteria bacterium]